MSKKGKIPNNSRIEVNQGEEFNNHQGQLLQEMCYGDWEEEAKKVLQSKKNLSALRIGTNALWIMRKVPLSRKPTLWVSENFVEFFRHYAFITTDDCKNFRLILIHHSSVFIDNNFTSLIAALDYFSANAPKAWSSDTLPTWKPISDERVKDALLNILLSCNEPMSLESNGKTSAAILRNSYEIQPGSSIIHCPGNAVN